jgi:hypothetical protein
MAHVQLAEQQAEVCENSDWAGRDAADVPQTQTIGENTKADFKIWTDELA